MSERRPREERRYGPYSGTEASWDRPAWLDGWSSAEELARTPGRPRRHARRRRRLGRWWPVIGALAGLVLLVLGGLYAVEWRFRGRILPNIYIANVPVGGLSPDDAIATLRLHYQSLEQQPLTVVYEDRVWQPSGEEIGLQISWEAAIAEAMAVGRQGSLQEDWRQRWRTWTGRYDLLLPATLDQETLRAYLEQLANVIDRPALDAALAVEGRQVSVRPGHAGFTLQVIPSMLEIKEALAKMRRQPVPLTVTVVEPEIDEGSVQNALETARQMLAGPITLHVEEQTWTLTPEQIGEMLTIERREELGHEILMVVLDQEALHDFVSAIAAEVRVRPRNAHFRFVEDHLEITESGVYGVEMPVDVAVDQINEAVLSTERDIEINLVEVPPAIRQETIEELGIREPVGMGESIFAGSRPYRVHNIAVASRILDGTLIAPGETFSFIESIGSIDESDGFVEGYSIIGGRTVLNVGGGVCQVSTTVFRAAFFAGLPIVERHAHDFRVFYYEQGSVLGMDATIYAGTNTDLRFRNDTKGYLLMQFEVYTDTGYLYVHLYGTKPDREVVMDGPYLDNWTPAPTEPVYIYTSSLPEGVVRQTDSAQPGVDATIYRHILVDGEVVSTDTFHSHYKAWPNVYEVGTGSTEP